MSETSRVLEDIRRQVTSTPDAFERLTRRRDRKRRNQRIGSAVLALIIAIAAIGGLVAAFREGTPPKPASGPISPGNVARLREVWSATLDGAASAPVSVGQTVLVASSGGTLYAFPSNCSGPACQPRWTAKLDGAGSTPLPLGPVWVSTASGTLYAFPLHCTKEICDPRWTVDLGGPATDLAVAIPGGGPWVGSVFVAADTSRTQGDATLYAFPPSCWHSATCSPAWHAAIPGKPFAPVWSGAVYVGHGPGPLYAFPLVCGKNDHECSPLWVGIPGLGATFSGPPVWGNNRIYVLTDLGVVALPGNCLDQASCQVIWRSDPVSGMAMIAREGQVFVSSQEGGVFAYPTDCGQDGDVCQPSWTGTIPGASAFGSLAESSDVLYVGSRDGRLFAFDATCEHLSCSPLWSTRVGSGGPFASIPTEPLC